MNNFPEYESFKHGLVTSKIWLCEELEKSFLIINYKNPTVHMLAAWHNLLSFMLLVRKPKFYNEIFAYDIDPLNIEASDKICNAWLFESPAVKNIVADVNTYKKYNTFVEPVFINCSVDQIETTQWYENIPSGSLVCLQTTNLDIEEHPWYIRTITKTIDDFEKKFPITQKLFLGTKTISYGNWGYNRFMLIGIK